VPYTLGSTNTGLTGTGQLAVANLVGVRAIVTAVPARIGSRPGTPQDRFGLGHVTPGDANGWDSNLPLQHVEHLFYPLRDGISVLGYSLVPGVTVTLQLLTGELAAARRLPIDRNPVVWSAAPAYTAPAGSGETVMYTYTVPAGRTLMVQHAQLIAAMAGAPTSPTYLFTIITVNGTSLLTAYTNYAVFGQPVQSLLGAEMAIPAGNVLQVRAGNYNGGSSAIHFANLWGFLFDT
jgi:hypothetical protein